MACLIAPATAAIVTAAINKKIPARYRVNWLFNMLLGATIVLTIDHLASGELVPYAPFLTAGSEKILPEIFAIGVPMVLTVTLVWAIMVIASNKKIIRPAHEKHL